MHAILGKRRKHAKMGRHRLPSAAAPADLNELPEIRESTQASRVYYNAGADDVHPVWDTALRVSAQERGRSTVEAERLAPRAGDARASSSGTAPENADMRGIISLLKHAVATDSLHLNTAVYEASEKETFDQEENVSGRPMPADLPIFSVLHEQKLLVETHSLTLPTGRTVETRPCMYGQNCMGMRDNLPGHDECGGVVLREALTPIELELFERTGECPSQKRPCVLCARYQIATVYFEMENGTGDDTLKNCILNWYINPRDCTNGYKSEYMVPCEGSKGWHCMCGSVCMVILHKLRLVQDRERNLWRVTQNELEWAAPSQLQISLTAPAPKRPKLTAAASPQPLF